MNNLANDEQERMWDRLEETLQALDAKMEILAAINKRHLAQQDGINDTEDSI